MLVEGLPTWTMDESLREWRTGRNLAWEVKGIVAAEVLYLGSGPLRSSVRLLMKVAKGQAHLNVHKSAPLTIEDLMLNLLLFAPKPRAIPPPCP